MAIKQYICVDSDEKTTNQQVKLENTRNELTGKLISTDPNGDEAKDVRELFVADVTVDGQPAEVTNENGKRTVHLQTSGGTVKSVSLSGHNNSKINGVLDEETGNVDINIEEIQFDQLHVEDLYLEGKNIVELIPDLSEIQQMEGVGNPNRIQDIASKLNELIGLLKNAAALSSQA